MGMKQGLRVWLAAVCVAVAPGLLRAGAEGDAKSEAPQASRAVALPLGSVDAVSGALSFKVPLGPKLPGRIPLGFHWVFNSQDGTQGLIGGCLRPVVWPGGSSSPLQTTVVVEGEPWVFNTQAQPAAMPTAASFIKWAQDRNVLSQTLDSPPTVGAVASSDGTKFYVTFTFLVDGMPPSIVRAVLYEDSAIWTTGSSDGPSDGARTTHFTNRWGDHVTVVEGPTTTAFGAPTQITITNLNHTGHTITLSASTGATTQVGGESRYFSGSTTVTRILLKTWVGLLAKGSSTLGPY